MISPALSTARSRAAERSRSWQLRRTELLKAACNDVAHRVSGGVKLLAAIKIVARKYRNRSLGDGRQLALSEKSLYTHWTGFHKRGDSAFVCRYVAGLQADLDPLLLQLVLRSSILEAKSVSEVLVEAGVIGDRLGRASFRTIYRALPTAEIRKFLVAEKRLLTRRKASERALLAINAQLRDLRSAAEEKFLAKGTA
jgi:hypothetical protein